MRNERNNNDERKKERRMRKERNNNDERKKERKKKEKRKENRRKFKKSFFDKMTFIRQCQAVQQRRIKMFDPCQLGFQR